VDLTCEFYRRNYIEGLFLSSGIFADPDIVMEKLIETAKKLRTEEGYGGYIHLKLIPGTGEKMIREAGKWADRLSVNIELPTEKSLQSLAPEKTKENILGAMNDFSCVSCEYEEDRNKSKFMPQGKTKEYFFAQDFTCAEMVEPQKPVSLIQTVFTNQRRTRHFRKARVVTVFFIRETAGMNESGIVHPP
jgi:predicted DNA-binding helix-hairpin-helix protein